MNERMSRRAFIKAGAGASVAGPLASTAAAVSTQPSGTTQARPGSKMIWANLLHLSYNMWCDWDSPELKDKYTTCKPHLRFDGKLWDDLLKKMTDVGMTMVLIDLGDGVKYQSHPEIAVKNAWPVDQLKKQLARIRRMGLEPIPKLNFSATHDAWLGPYSRCVSTDAYYAVCRDLIAEVTELFDKPRFFHLGLDEETARHQRHHEYVVIRQFDLWWRDFCFYVEQVTKNGSRPWIWADYLWHHPEDFFKKMPRSVLQSNWYYGTEFGKDLACVKAYHDLEEHGYDQVPTGSNWSSPENFGLTVEYCARHLDPARLLGFMQAPWHPTVEACRRHHTEALDQVARAMARLRGCAESGQPSNL